MARLTVVGIGARPLDERARKAVLAAEAVIGTRRTCEVFARYAEFADVRAKVRQMETIGAVMASIREALEKGSRRIVLLASGDPLFFGAGRRAIEEFGPDDVEVIPDVASFQLAFSRIRTEWDDALLISFHGSSDSGKRRRLRYSPADLPGLLAEHTAIAVLTDREHGPAEIALALQCATDLWPSLTMHVCERLGFDDERIREGPPGTMESMAFNDPNVVIVTREGRTQTPGAGASRGAPRLGLREEEIAHTGGLITKDEVRAVTLHALRLPGRGVMWDIGAGSGAVSAEAARLSPRLRIFAVEKKAAQLAKVRENRASFGLPSIEAVEGEAPSALAPLPAPDRVFVGGSGEKLAEIIETVGSRMEKGVVVVNAATLDTLNEALAGLEKAGFRVGVSQVSVTRMRPAGKKRLMAALNPVFVITGEKG
jgi:precorrin-6Y C5,15-methyltransferase (decarboxylating)